jgi:hypothetical protein
MEQLDQQRKHQLLAWEQALVPVELVEMVEMVVLMAAAPIIQELVAVELVGSVMVQTEPLVLLLDLVVISPLNGGQGGLQGPQDGAGRGGFGGGGGHGGNDGAGGGGGGYNGGGGGNSWTGSLWGSGGGGGSFNGGTNQTNVAGTNGGNGQLMITYSGTAALVQTEGLPSGAEFPVGTTVNTFVVTDASGNTATCSFEVTVTDDEAPDLTCPANATVVTSDGGETGDCVGQLDWDHPVASDNCGIDEYVVTYTNPDGTIDGPLMRSRLIMGTTSTAASRNFELGVTTVTYSV